MTRVLVLYYSSWGHVETMAEAVATGALWAQGRLVGKVGSVFAVTGTQHGGQETTLTSFHTTLLHHGMVIVGLPYAFDGLVKMDEVSGGTPYGATALAGADGSRAVSANELAGAHFQGRHVATLARDLALGRAAPAALAA